MFDRIDHVGIAVADLDDAIALYADTLRLTDVYRERLDESQVEIAQVRVDGSHVELLLPLSPDSPVGRFLDRNGPGLHHIAYRVDDITAALAELRARGVELIDPVPRTGVRNSKIAFLHPRSVGGVLTELVQRADDH